MIIRKIVLYATLIVALGNNLMASAGVEELIPGEVYTFAVTATSGERACGAVEKISDKNIGHWRKYLSSTDTMLVDSRGPLILAALYSEQKPEDQEFINGMKQATTFHGYTEMEFLAFLKDLNVKKAYSKETQVALDAIRAGAIGCDIHSDGNVYMVYLSRKPVAGYREFKDLPEFVMIF